MAAGLKSRGSGKSPDKRTGRHARLCLAGPNVATPLLSSSSHRIARTRPTLPLLCPTRPFSASRSTPLQLIVMPGTALPLLCYSTRRVAVHRFAFALPSNASPCLCTATPSRALPLLCRAYRRAASRLLAFAAPSTTKLSHAPPRLC